MRILIISHAYVERANHKKLEVLSSFPSVELGVVYPKSWQTWHGEAKQAGEAATAAGYQEFPLGTHFGSDGGKYVYSAAGLIGTLRSFKPDVVYLEEEPFSHVAFQVSLYCRILGIRSVFFTWENLDLKLGCARDIFEKFTFAASARAVVGNSEAAARLKKRGFKKPLLWVPQFGVDTEMFKRAGEIRKGGQPLVIGFVGRPSTAKGIDILMKAVSKLPFECQLLLVTSSPKISREFLDLCSSLGIMKNTAIKTSVPFLSLPDYYHQMDIFVLPSRTTQTWKEQFGRTLLEAMACGVPVVGSSSGAIPEVVGDAGLIFKEGDDEDLARQLTKLVNPNQREYFVQVGCLRVAKNYTYPKICEDLVEFLSR